MTPPRVLIGCEFSGTVRRAFTERGYDAWSCDLLPAEDRSNRHITGDVRDVLSDGWDMLIVAHPPCTRLCNSGVRWLSSPPPGKTLDQMWAELDEGAALFSELWNAPVPRVAVENPVMHRHAKDRIVGFQPAAQSVQPWEYGDWETKRTCLWLRGLPALVPTYPTIAAARAGLGIEVAHAHGTRRGGLGPSSLRAPARCAVGCGATSLSMLPLPAPPQPPLRPCRSPP